MDYSKKIKIKAWEFFIQQGIKNTAIEQICQELKISKKTFYKYFRNKEDLLLQIFMSNRQVFFGIFEKGLREKVPPMVILLRIIQQFKKMIRPQTNYSLNEEETPFFPISPSIIEELPSLYPEVWQTIDGFRHDLLNQIANLLENEKEEYIREEINTKVISKMLFAIIEQIIHPQFLNTHKIPFHEVFNSAFTLLFKGIIKNEKQEEITRMVIGVENNERY
ncbi:MAG: TetR/AcrR family transcriptional regulator [Tepidibacillus sp.]